MKRCPACQTDTPAADFLAGLCPTCFAAGTPIPLGHTEPLTTKALVRVSGGRRGTRAIPPEAPAREGDRTMETTRATKRPCPKCGREFLPAGYGRHVPGCAGYGSADQTRRPDPRRAPQERAKERRTPSKGSCESCLFRGLERHVDQELVRRAVLGGMALDAACAFVRDAKAAMGGGRAEPV